tara:strand:- start:376 stop:495 length:120 start_codon:yes stop_codon:yes gene_type:complete
LEQSIKDIATAPAHHTPATKKQKSDDSPVPTEDLDNITD